MRRYPIGTLLAWETKEKISYRPFIKDYHKAYDFDEDIRDGEDGVSRRYILDGQQRLQSLYIARYGSYDKDVLFFDLTSDPDGEFGYVFDFKPEKPQKGTWLNVKEFLNTPYRMTSSIPTELMKKGIIPSHFNEETKARRQAAQQEQTANHRPPSANASAFLSRFAGQERQPRRPASGQHQFRSGRGFLFPCQQPQPARLFVPKGPAGQVI